MTDDGGGVMYEQETQRRVSTRVVFIWYSYSYSYYTCIHFTRPPSFSQDMFVYGIAVRVRGFWETPLPPSCQPAGFHGLWIMQRNARLHTTHTHTHTLTHT